MPFTPPSRAEMAYLGFAGSGKRLSHVPVPHGRNGKSEQGSPGGMKPEAMEAVRVNSVCSPEQRPPGCARNTDFGIKEAGQ